MVLNAASTISTFINSGADESIFTSDPDNACTALLLRRMSTLKALRAGVCEEDYSGGEERQHRRHFCAPHVTACSRAGRNII